MKKKYIIYFINRFNMKDGQKYYITTSKERAIELFNNEYNKIADYYEIIYIQE